MTHEFHIFFNKQIIDNHFHNFTVLTLYLQPTASPPYPTLTTGWIFMFEIFFVFVIRTEKTTNKERQTFMDTYMLVFVSAEGN